MIMKKYTCILLGIIAFLLVSCEANTPQKKATLRRVDVTDASAVFLSNKSVVDEIKRMPRRLRQDGDSLASMDAVYKITTSGNIEEVTFLDENGEVIDMGKPEWMAAIPNTPYCFILFDAEYLINTKTGYVYNWTEATRRAGLRMEMYEGQDKYWMAMTDKQNNLYICYHRFSEEADGLFKIYPDERLEGKLYMDQLVRSGDDIMIVSDDGALIARNLGRQGIGLYTGKGEYIENFVSGLSGLIFRGLDGKIHGYVGGGGWSYDIDSDGNVTVNVVYDGEEVDANDDWSHSVFFKSDYAKLRFMTVDNKMYALDNKKSILHIIDSYTPTDLLQNTVINDGIFVLQSDYINETLYCSGVKDNKCAIYKTDMHSLQSTRIFETPDYEIYSFFVQNDGSILFSGMNMNTGTSVFASIAVDGTLNILSEQDNSLLVVIQRLA